MRRGKVIPRAKDSRLDWEEGHAVAVCEDGWGWSKAERDEKGLFRILFLPGVPAEKFKHLELPRYDPNDLLSLDPDVYTNPKVLDRKRYKVDPSKLTAEMETDLSDDKVEVKTREDLLKTTVYDLGLDRYENTDTVVVERP
jgi:hypothetical protein